MVRRQQRPRRKTGASIPDITLEKKGRPAKERVQTNNPTLKGVFINNTRKEGGGATLEVVDEDPNITTHIIEPRSSQIVNMDLQEQGNMVKIETENRYGKKEASFITQIPNDPGFENKLREGQLLSDIKKTTKNQSSGLANKYKQHEIRSLAEHVGAKVDASNITTINNIRKKIATRKTKEVQKQEFTILQPTQHEVRKSEILTTPQVKRHDYYVMAVHDATNLDQLTAIHKELVDDKGLPDIYKKEVKYAIEYKTNDLRERHIKQQISSDQEQRKYIKKINDAHTKEQLEKLREQIILSKASLTESETNTLNKHWWDKWKFLQDLESDRDGQKYLTEIKQARSEKDLELVKRQIANNKTFNPTEGQIETLNKAFEKKTQDLMDNKKDEKQLTQEMEDLLSNKQKLDYKNLSGKKEEDFRKQFKQGYIPPYRKDAGATTYYKDDIEYYFYTEPATGVIKFEGAESQITRQPVHITIPEVQKRLGWETIDIETMGL